LHVNRASFGIAPIISDMKEPKLVKLKILVTPAPGSFLEKR
jgi:hypothetical protein